MEKLIKCIIAFSMVVSLSVSAEEIDLSELSPQLEKEVACLAKNIYYEAGGEVYDGKVAVAQVTVNRANSGKYPSNDICGVVKQKTVYKGKLVCQFSWYCTDKAHKSLPLNSMRYKESLEIAYRVLIEGMVLDHLSDALYFHEARVNPRWGKVRVARIGNHIFYKDRR